MRVLRKSTLRSLRKCNFFFLLSLAAILLLLSHLSLMWRFNSVIASTSSKKQVPMRLPKPKSKLGVPSTSYHRQQNVPLLPTLNKARKITQVRFPKLVNFLVDATNTTETLSLLPQWIQDYFMWHSQERTAITSETYQQHQYLVLRCRSVDSTCGGLSDRLKILPLLVLLASASRRVLLIHWQRPAPLEEFLLPAFIVDWRMPDYMLRESMESTHPYTNAAKLANALARHKTTRFVEVRIQDQHGGSNMYNALEDYRMDQNLSQFFLPLPKLNFTSRQSTKTDRHRHFRRVFRPLWALLFAPSPSVAKDLIQRQTQLGLTTSHNNSSAFVMIPYVAAHVRAFYGNRPVPPKQRASVAINAVHCASALRQSDETPVVLVSDSRQVLQAARDYAHAADSEPLPIRTALPPHEPLHLDKANSTTTAAKDFRDIFVDLYILANAECITHGVGGFGRFGVLLSRNSSCFFKYFAKAQYESCLDWKFFF